MTIEGKRLEHSIYYEAWTGDISAQDVYDSAHTRAQWAREDGCAACYTIIMDGETTGKLPPISSLVSASNAHPSGALEFVIINVPPFHRIMAQMFGRFARHPIRIAYSLEEAIAYGRARHKAKMPAE